MTHLWDSATGTLFISSDHESDSVIVVASGSGPTARVHVNNDDVASAMDVRRIIVDVGGGNDTVDLSGVNAEFTGLTADAISVHGGDGDDLLTGSDFDDLLAGGTGDDVVHGGNGNDTILGGPDDDQLNGQNGDDDILGDGVVVTRRVAGPNDDGRELASDATVDLSLGSLTFGESVGESHTIGLRFTDVSIPENARIDRALLTFVARGAPGTGDFTGRWHAENSKDPPPFVSVAGHLSTRANNPVNFTMDGNSDDFGPWNSGQPHSIDVTSLVQNLADEFATESIVLLHQHNGGSGHRSALSFENDPEAAPLLSVIYSMATGDDEIEGGTGDDNVDGGEGNDTYIFSDLANVGRDVVDEVNDGIDTFDFSNANQTVGIAVDLSDSQGDIVRTNDPAMVVIVHTTSGHLIENVVGTIYDDVIRGNINLNRLEGGFGDDTLDGREGGDTLEGGPGNDTLFGGSGSDTYRFAGSLLGVDSIDESDANGVDAGGINRLDFSLLSHVQGATIDLDDSQGEVARINDPAGTVLVSTTTSHLLENVIGTRYDDVIRGNDANNRLEGRVGNDTLDGRVGNDTLIGATGSDTIFGRSGDDVYVFDGSPTMEDTISESDGGGNDAGGLDTLDFSRLAHRDGIRVDLADPQGAIARTNMPLNISLVQSQTGAMFEHIIGTSFNDTLLGNDADNVLQAGVGHDIVNGRGGADTLEGGSGNDTYLFTTDGTSFDSVDETDGSGNDAGGEDTLDFAGFDDSRGISVGLDRTQTPIAHINQPGGETIVSSASGHLLEHLVGTAFDDQLTGNDSDNRIDGGAGSDVLEGGAGDDTYIFSGSVLQFDTINETDGNGSDAGGSDTLDFAGLTHAQGVNVVLNGGQLDVAHVNLPVGTTIAKTTDGNLLENVIGSDFDDWIQGNSANNRLEGRSGNDTLAGLGGDDTYVFAGAITSFDTIDESDAGGEDAGGTDTLDLSGLTETEGATVDLNDLGGKIARLNGPSSIELARSETGVFLERVVGSNFDDTIYGHDLANTLLGGPGNDTLDGRGGSDTLEGEAGHDMLLGQAGDDTYIFAGTEDLGVDTIGDLVTDGGEDWLDFSQLDFGTGLEINLSNEAVQRVIHRNFEQLYLVLEEPEAIENVIGTDYGDLIIGNSLGNRLEGRRGDDTYIFTHAGAGVSHVEEVENGGTDTLDFSRMSPLLSNGIEVDLSATDGMIAATNTSNPISLVTSSTAHFLENVVGTSFDDQIYGNELANGLDGGPGSDNLAGMAGNDLYLFTGLLTQSDWIDETDGLGNDAGGNDTLDFSNLEHSEGITVELDSSQTDVARTNLPVGVLLASSARRDLLEDVVGTPFDDRLVGNASPNRLDGRLGNDDLFGRAGDDTYVFSQVEGSSSIDSDTVSEEDSTGSDAGGTDILDFSQLTKDFIALGVTVDLSNAANDQVATPTHLESHTFVTSTTKPWIESVIGTRFNDVIYGNDGNNRLEGGPGDDTLSGGVGDDIYLFSGTNALGTDSIHEGSNEGNADRLDFSEFKANAPLNLETETGSNEFETRFGGVRVDLTHADDSSSGARDKSVLQLDLTGAAAGIEEIIGSAYDDIVIGNASANLIVGNAGDDLLIGDEGDDVIYGGTFDGVIHARAGSDIILGEGGTDLLFDYEKWNDDFKLPTDNDFATIATPGGDHATELQHYLDQPELWNSGAQIHRLHSDAQHDAALAVARMPAGRYLIGDPGEGGTNAIQLAAQHDGHFILGTPEKTVIQSDVAADDSFSGGLLSVGTVNAVNELTVSGLSLRYAKRVDDALYGVLFVRSSDSVFDWISVNGPRSGKDPSTDFATTVYVGHPTRDTIFRGVDVKNSAGNIVGHCACIAGWEFFGTPSGSGSSVTEADDRNVTLLNSTVQFADHDGVKLIDPVENLRIIRGSYSHNGGDGIDLAGGGQAGILVSGATTSNNDLNGIDFKEVLQAAPILGNLSVIDVTSNANVTGAGIQIKDSQNVLVSGGSFNGNGTDGVKLNGASFVRVEDVVAEANSHNGVSVIQNSKHVEIVDPIAHHNRRAGMNVVTAYPDAILDETGVVVQGGSFSFNDQNGILVWDADDVTLRGTLVQNNNALGGSFPGVGIQVNASDDITIEHSVVSGNQNFNLDVRNSGPNTSERIHVVDSLFSNGSYEQGEILPKTTFKNIRFHDTTGQGDLRLERYRSQYLEATNTDDIPLDPNGQSQPPLDEFQSELNAIDAFFLGAKDVKELIDELFSEPPRVISMTRNDGAETYQTLDQLHFAFNEPVELGWDALALINESSGGEAVDLTGIVFVRDATRSTATWSFDAMPPLAPGSYKVVLEGRGVVAETGLPLDGDDDGVGGGQFTESFVVAILGDVNLDLSIDESDWNALSMNYDPQGNNTGNEWFHGNFDGDGDVDVSDLMKLLLNAANPAYAPSATNLSSTFDGEWNSTGIPNTLTRAIGRSVEELDFEYLARSAVEDSAVEQSFSDRIVHRTDWLVDDMASVRRLRASMRRVEENLAIS